MVDDDEGRGGARIGHFRLVAVDGRRIFAVRSGFGGLDVHGLCLRIAVRFRHFNGLRLN